MQCDSCKWTEEKGAKWELDRNKMNDRTTSIHSFEDTIQLIHTSYSAIDISAKSPLSPDKQTNKHFCYFHSHLLQINTLFFIQCIVTIWKKGKQNERRWWNADILKPFRFYFPTCTYSHKCISSVLLSSLLNIGVAYSQSWSQTKTKHKMKERRKKNRLK